MGWCELPILFVKAFLYPVAKSLHLAFSFLLFILSLVFAWVQTCQITFNRQTYSNRRVIITGASFGIGRELAVKFASLGADVALLARREAELKLVAEECKRVSPRSDARIMCFPMDLSNTQRGFDCLRRVLQEFGGVDVLCLNHGLTSLQKFREYSTAETLAVFDNVMNVGYASYVGVVAACLPALEQAVAYSAQAKRAGCREKNISQILVTSSAEAIIGCGIPGMSSIAPPKFALNGFFETLRCELHGSGVEICIACPNMVATGNREVIRVAGPPSSVASDQATASVINMNTAKASVGISGAKCADLMIEGLSQRRRVIIFSWLDLFSCYARVFFPGFVDAAVRTAFPG